MIRAAAVTLVAQAPVSRGVYETPTASTGREVACDVMSVGRREYYEARSHGLDPEWVLVLSDYAEYAGEKWCSFEGRDYRIIRTYVRDDHRIELTIERMVATP